jgi:hypothetical protein
MKLALIHFQHVIALVIGLFLELLVQLVNHFQNLMQNERPGYVYIFFRFQIDLLAFSSHDQNYLLADFKKLLAFLVDIFHCHVGIDFHFQAFIGV